MKKKISTKQEWETYSQNILSKIKDGVAIIVVLDPFVRKLFDKIDQLKDQNEILIKEYYADGTAHKLMDVDNENRVLLDTQAYLKAKIEKLEKACNKAIEWHVMPEICKKILLDALKKEE